jgi:para-nitrobenzyl esterase
LAASGCDRDAGDNTAEPEAAAQAPDSMAESDATTSSAGAGTDAGSTLSGTSWRLVKISSMDDTEHVPDDPSKYTLTFGADGDATIVADCNRGMGTYTSESRSQLQFGPIASTKALCPPDSLHDVYMVQFEWVRSYVFEDGHLFLATMADGSIIEFEPVSTGPNQ